MTQEEKDLLLKDLCARLPYGVKVFNNSFGGVDAFNLVGCDGEELIDDERYWYMIEDCKPYLFPLSSMTEEQKKEYNTWKHQIFVSHYEYGDVVEEVELFDSPESFEYLIENHFDYRGLIERGLALDATGLNIY